MKKPGKARGRPPKDASEVKSESFLLRLTPAEKTAFAGAASLAGIPLSSWIRERLRTNAKRELEEARQTVAFLPVPGSESEKPLPSPAKKK